LVVRSRAVVRAVGACGALGLCWVLAGGSAPVVAGTVGGGGLAVLVLLGSRHVTPSFSRACACAHRVPGAAAPPSRRSLRGSLATLADLGGLAVPVAQVVQ